MTMETPNFLNNWEDEELDAWTWTQHLSEVLTHTQIQLIRCSKLLPASWCIRFYLCNTHTLKNTSILIVCSISCVYWLILFLLLVLHLNNICVLYNLYCMYFKTEHIWRSLNVPLVASRCNNNSCPMYHFFFNSTLYDKL